MIECFPVVFSNLVQSNIDIFIPMLSEWLFDPIVQAAQNTGITIIASEHNDPWKIEELWWSHNKRVECFKKVDYVHLLLNKYKKSLPNNLSDKVITIPNGINIKKNNENINREKLIISVGRLEKQKRFDKLVDAVNLSKQKLREEKYHIEIYGEGSLYNDLEKQIISYDIYDLISLKGNNSKIEEVYKKADFYIMSSDFEGFPIVLLEAFSFRLPIIAFKDCIAANELITDNVNGFLVQDIKELAKKIEYLTTQKDKAKIRERAYETSEKYSLDNFYEQWLNLLKG